jgi:hypothetical protein
VDAIAVEPGQRFTAQHHATVWNSAASKHKERGASLATIHWLLATVLWHVTVLVLTRFGAALRWQLAGMMRVKSTL